MKKIAIIAVLTLTTGLTALSISRKTKRTEAKSTIAEKTDAVTSTTVLATAD